MFMRILSTCLMLLLFFTFGLMGYESALKGNIFVQCRPYVIADINIGERCKGRYARAGNERFYIKDGFQIAFLLDAKLASEEVFKPDMPLQYDPWNKTYYQFIPPSIDPNLWLPGLHDGVGFEKAPAK